MCRTRHFHSPKCGHEWYKIITPCDKDKNFSNCESFKNMRLRSSAENITRNMPLGECPECGKKGEYDGNMIRMVASREYAISLGRIRPGAPRGMSGGWEILCCVVM